jgi:hypothetical protein
MTETLLNFREFNSHHIKAIKVIMSCETLDQLDGAERFCEAVMKFHITKMNQSVKSGRQKYKEAIESSAEKLQQALKDKKLKIKYGKKR